ncbi:DNA ligase D [Flavipsychrobacter stenotrophus]|uniref:DNA ligase (ATP) n=1 Tax=Flavipsychrobacter stenotrophus TaxID=2077091 RepID=A0A2S7SPP9_9BACT|nr:DNA ligase D [Flavipsychrobacter stenotrophus]PQJ08872.1 DNA ligase D [Flavipsychrobacter stenotrophus]
MSLKKYKAKRSFKDTPEPTGGKVVKDELRFVIQKHDASHLHYDFRLEMEGVLKSWAVPKGPSTDPEVKRLAMMVEDHPYDYRTFEGIIPEGNYGAGTVIVWDEGTYTALDSKGKDKKTQEKELLHQLHSGNLKFALKGKKLKGEFALVRTKGYTDNSWLLIKHDDKYAVTTDITLKDKSVISKHTLKPVEAHPENIYGQTKKPAKKAASKAAPGSVKKAAAEKQKDEAGEEVDVAIVTLLKPAKKVPFPKMEKPMLAMRADKPFDNKDWIYEIKWDGYRAVSFLKGGKVDIRSRNDQPFAEKFSSITAALQNWKVDAVVDGEIIALKDDGNADFQALQNFARKGKATTLAYFVFDLLWYNGKDMRHLPLKDRKQVLKSIMPEDDGAIRYSDHIESKGIEFFNAAKKQGLEGIMAKDANSEYVTGSRTDSWLKIKNDQVLEAIICGFTKPRNSRAHFGAVILGKYVNKKLTYIGHSGSGFNDKELKELSAKFKPLITDKCPFKELPLTNMPVTWMKPELICDVQFTEWTGDKVLRHPIFKGLREDKSAKNEKDEKIVHVPAKKAGNAKVVEAKASVAVKDSKNVAIKKTTTRKTDAIEKQVPLKKAKATAKALFSADEKESTIIVENQEIKFTNLTKLYWPKEKVTKGDMLSYYHQVAAYILPYLLGRPQSLNRFPEGIMGFSFYQKDVEGKVADWLTTHPYFSDSGGVYKKYLVCTGEASLLYTANLGCIEMNPWHSRIQSPDNPDWCVIDLDPDKNSFDQVIEVALVVKELLDSVKVPSFCKTSGSTGLHIYIPLGAKYSYDQSKLLAELIVNIVHNELPDFTSIERTVSKRKGKIYLDFLQNRTIQTIAAPYSLRPKPGATVSTPLDWSEVKKGLKMADFNIKTILSRLKVEGDLFKGVLGKGINVDATIKRINTLL